MSEIFITGVTGYIGGQVLCELTRNQPTLSISALVRDSKKAEVISRDFPHVRVVLGDLDSIELLEQEAAKASVVLHLAATGHMKSVEAIHRGLKQQKSSASPYWIQVSGASALAVGELSSPAFVPGASSTTIFDDLSGVASIRDLIRAHPSRAVDNYLLNVAAEHSHIKTALVFPPLIYGEGEGTSNRRSMQLPALSSLILDKGHEIRVGKGLSIWGNVHVRDVGRLFTGLTEAAVKHNDQDGLWGEDGIYLTGVGEMTFSDMSSRVAAVARDRGLFQSDAVEELDHSMADQLLPSGSVLFGTNARSKARRARELLQWEPKEESLEAEIPRAVAEENKRRKDALA